MPLSTQLAVKANNKTKSLSVRRDSNHSRASMKSIIYETTTTAVPSTYDNYDLDSTENLTVAMNGDAQPIPVLPHNGTAAEVKPLLKPNGVAITINNNN